MSQDALADALGVSKATVSSWERDESNPRFELLAALRAALAASLDWIVTGERAPGPADRTADADPLAMQPPAEGEAFSYANAYSYANSTQSLGLAEFRLVARFRELPSRKRQALLDLLAK